MRFFPAVVSALFLIGAVSSTASAQTEGSPVFRVPMGQSASGNPVTDAWIWNQQVATCSTTCGTGTRATTFECQNATDFNFNGTGYGAAEPDAQCTTNIGPKPASSSESCTVYSGCTYDWVKPPVTNTPVALGTNPLGRVGCGQVREAFNPTCRREDGTVLAGADHAFCRNDLPDYNDVATRNPDALGFNRLVVQTAQCDATDHDWIIGNWSPPSSTCSTTAFTTRTLSCKRRFDGSVAADSACSTPAPETVNVTPNYSTCSYSYVPDAWGAYDNSCSATATRTRTVTCLRSNGDTVPNAQCAAAGETALSSTETAPIYSSCTYSWDTTAWSAYDSTCSASATRTRSATCQRSDGTNMPDSSCTTAKPTTSETSAQYGSCSYNWNVGSWTSYSSACSATATRTRSVVCERSNGDSVADSNCTSTKPDAVEITGQYGGCGYSVTNWTAWASANTCSASTTQTRYATACERSDGTAVPVATCASNGTPTTQTQSGIADYSGCGFAWQSGTWSAYSSTCSATAARSRSVVCLRADGTVVSDSNCPAASRPAATDVSGQYSGCSYAISAWSGWTSANTCSASTTQTRNATTCQRSDGTDVPLSTCASNGVATTQTQSGIADYSGCGFTWQTSNWSGYSSTCSSNATRSRSVFCQRADGVTVADGNCPAASRPDATEVSGQYGGCSYTVSIWSAYVTTSGGGSTCSSNATQTRTATSCQRSDGTPVDPSLCAANGTPTTETRTAPDYSGCGYNWQVGSWSAYSSTCSATATQTRSVTCLRSDGTIVSDSNCSAASRPDPSQISAQYGGCSYTPEFGPLPSCSNGTQTRTANCRRSDGVLVAGDLCGYPGSVQTQSCSSLKTVLMATSGLPSVVTGFSSVCQGASAGEVRFSQSRGTYYPTGEVPVPANATAISVVQPRALQILADQVKASGRDFQCVEFSITTSARSSDNTFYWNAYTGNPYPSVPTTPVTVVF